MYIIDFILYFLLFLCLLVLVAIVAGLVYQFIITIYRKTLRYETFHDTAVVCNKEHSKEHSTTSLHHVGKVLMPHTNYYAAQYNVYLMYNCEEHCFDDEDLYNHVNIGNVIHVLVHKGYNKRGKLKHMYLSIEI